MNEEGENDPKHAWDAWRTPADPPDRFWIHEALPRYLPKPCVFLYEYDAKKVFLQGTLQEEAQTFQESILAMRVGVESTPLIFVGHAYGQHLILGALSILMLDRKIGPDSGIRDVIGFVNFKTPQSSSWNTMGREKLLIGPGRRKVIRVRHPDFWHEFKRHSFPNLAFQAISRTVRNCRHLKSCCIY